MRNLLVATCFACACLAPAHAAPTAPQPLSPTGTVGTEEYPVFRWNETPGASRYDFFIYDIAAREIAYRERSVLPSSCDEGVCSHLAPFELTGNSLYLWRVSQIVPYSGKSPFARQPFDTLTGTVPDAPVLLSPNENTSNPPDTDLSFRWSAVPGAIDYNLIVFDRVAGNDVVRERNLDPTNACELGPCEYILPAGSLTTGRNHVWRIAARNAAGRSTFSRATFDVSESTPPEPPLLLFPADGEILPPSALVAYEWSERSGASSYDFYVYDKSAREIVYRDRVVPSAICVDTVCRFPTDDVSLSAESDHVWRVAARNGAGRSSFSRADFAFESAVRPPPTPPNPILADYELAFEDDFTGPTLDTTKWYTSFLWGPYETIDNEQQLYVDTEHMHSDFPYSPFEMTGETLKITATPVTPDLQPPPRPPEGDPLYKRKHSTYRYNGPDTDPDTGVTDPGYRPEEVDYLSGVITSYDSFEMTHGYVEMRARLPAGQGLWPAFWMHPKHYLYEVPEIDVMEFLGHQVDRLYNTYHFFDVPAGWKLISSPSFPVYNDDWTQDFHTFGAAWSPGKITWYVDGVETHSLTENDTAPAGRKYDIAAQAMYLIANLAVGGNWPGDADETTPFPAVFEIDCIRAYKKRTADPIDLAADYQLMFQDEFDGSSLDPTKWNSHFLWGPYLPINREEQYYIDALQSDADMGYSPFSLDGGVLSITARAADDPAGVPPPAQLPDIDDPVWTDHRTFRRNADYAPQSFTSGMLTSYDSFRFANGYAEIRAKIPKGDGLWPAFWLLNACYVSQQPEIDIFEFRGRRPDRVVHNYHRYEPGGILRSDEYVTTNDTPELGYSDDFHTYGARWRPGRIDFYVDGVREHSYVGEDVGYQLMYVIVNLAVGGGFDPGATPDPAEFPKTLDIDYIRVCQEKDHR